MGTSPPHPSRGRFRPGPTAGRSLKGRCSRGTPHLWESHHLMQPFLGARAGATLGPGQGETLVDHSGPRTRWGQSEPVSTSGVGGNGSGPEPRPRRSRGDPWGSSWAGVRGVLRVRAVCDPLSRSAGIGPGARARAAVDVSPGFRLGKAGGRGDSGCRSGREPGRSRPHTHCLGSCRAGAPRRWKAPSTKTPFLPRQRR